MPKILRKESGTACLAQAFPSLSAEERG